MLINKLVSWKSVTWMYIVTGSKDNATNNEMFTFSLHGVCMTPFNIISKTLIVTAIIVI